MKISIETDDAGRARATSPEYPEVSAEGGTAAEALASFELALNTCSPVLHIESCENCKINCEIKHIWSTGRCEKWRLGTERKSK